MNPIKIKFKHTIVTNDRGFEQGYTGVSRINETIIKVYNDFQGSIFLQRFVDELPHYKELITEAFKIDVENTTIGYKIADIKFDIVDLKEGRTPVVGTRYSFQYDVKVSIYSIEYTCIQITPIGNVYVCYDEQEEEKVLRTITGFNAEVIIL